jgi:hypothetical protein
VHFAAVWAFDVERCLPRGSQTEPEVSGLRPVEHRMLFEVEAEMRDREADASLGRSVGSTTAWELV